MAKYRLATVGPAMIIYKENDQYSKKIARIIQG
jgi:hypothetical protein